MVITPKDMITCYKPHSLFSQVQIATSVYAFSRASALRFFITSLTTVEEFARAVREHWCIENQLHWCLDVIFREDAARARKDNSPLNMNVMRKTALPLLKTADFGRIGIKKKMFRAALSVPSLEYILSGQK